MPARKCFIDTNIWLYAFINSDTDGQKNDRARTLIDRQGVAVSIQVINEVCVNLLKKTPLGESEIAGLISSFYRRYEVRESGEAEQLHASRLRSAYNFSYWDSLIVAAALGSGAGTLYSEDMHDGLIVEGQLQISNPFSHQARP